MASEEEYRKLKVLDLKALLKKKGLSTAGVKEELISRLTQVDTETEGEPSADQEDEIEPDSKSELSRNGDESGPQKSDETAEKGKDDEGGPEKNENNAQEDDADVQSSPKEGTSLTQPEASTEQPQKRKAEHLDEESIHEKQDHGNKEVGEVETEIVHGEHGREERAAIHPPTRALYIANLTRPIQKREFVDFITRTTGHAAEYAWIDRLRTHGFFVFTSPEASKEVRSALDDTKYPPGETSRQELFADFVPENLAYKWSKFEDEDKNRNSSKRFAVRYETGDDGKIIAIHYEKPSEEKFNKKQATLDIRDLGEVMWTKTQPSVCYAERR